MDKEPILSALRDVMDPAAQLAIRSKQSGWPPDLAEGIFLHEISRPVETILKRTKEFDGGTGFMVQMDNGSSGFHANEASTTLCKWVLAGVTPEAAVAQLAHIIATERAHGTGVLALWGVEVAAPVELKSGLTLLPFDSLPESNTKRWLRRSGDLSHATGLMGPRFLSPPKAAIAVAVSIEPFLHSVRAGDTPTHAEPHRNQTLLDDARLALTLVGPSCPIAAGYWFSFDDPLLAEAVHYGGVHTSYQEVLPWGFTPDVQLDPADSVSVVSEFMRLKEPLRATLRLALRRLNQALRRPSHGDRALDLAIALESLLVDGAGENTYKMGLRAALLLGGTLERRQEVRTIVGALYALRSALIHDGVLPSDVKVRGAGKRPSHELVSQATGISALVLREVLKRGAIPDWYEYELSDSGRPA